MKVIFNTEKERALCSLLDTHQGKKDLTHILMVKPWGIEYKHVDNGDCCSWCLHIEKGSGTSMHCHDLKPTVVLVLSGSIKLKLYRRPDVLMKAGDMIALDKRVFHSMNAVSVGTIVMEMETPSHKQDVVRLYDKWDRDGKPYAHKSIEVPIGTNITKGDEDNFRKVVAILNENKLDWWLEFGTLLGAIRSGMPIYSCQEDIDIGMFGKDKAKIEQLIKENPCFSSVDIYWHKKYVDGSESFRLMYGGRYYLLKLVFIEKMYGECNGTVRFLDIDCFIPDDSIGLLKMIYGDTWKIPYDKYLEINRKRDKKRKKMLYALNYGWHLRFQDIKLLD